MPIKLRIPGQPETVSSAAVRGASAGGVSVQPVTSLLDALEVVEAYNLSAAARDRTAAPAEFDANEDDILEIEVEGGFTLWTSAQRYSNDLALLKPDAVAADGSVLVDKLPRTSVSERGVKEWFQSALRILRLKKDPLADAFENPSQWPKDFVQTFGVRKVSELTAWLASKLIMRLIEGHLNPGPGLYTWQVATEKRAKDAPLPPTASFDDFDIEKPLLVFVHGTASSTLGSFGAFLADEAQPHWRVLRDAFGEQIYAFEHRTMSESPIDNAIQLVSALPRKAHVYLVSHSRGGMVGDLVCLNDIKAQHISSFKRASADLADADAHDRKNLEKLAAAIAHKQLHIERFVRCASPARGTLLAGENIDTFLSVLTNLVGLIPGIGGTPLYEVVKRVTLQIVKNRTEPELIPGIEAMMPSSPLVAFLNNSGGEAAGALGVVAGDIEGGGWLKRLGVFLTDHALYENGDNDLVVNTDSMFHGAERRAAYYVFDQGADVSHFNYFKNERTRASLLAWLGAKGSEIPPGFNTIGEGEVEPVPMLRSMQTRAGVTQPIVFVLPGIMGSHLTVDDSRVWLNYLALLAGGLSDLSAIDAKNIQPASLIGDYYRKLCEYLANSHEVIPFAYDWRKSIGDTAKLLATEVEKALGRSSQPVRLLAHSMGGLVVRAVIAQRPDLWDRLCDRDGGRFVMLGTPNRGSHSIVEALLGTATTIQQLALLDLSHSTLDITSIIARFPGILELLPNEDSFFRDATWKAFNKDIKSGAVPDGALLTRARTIMNGLAVETPLKHVDRVFYIAGSSGRTVRKVEIVNRRIVLEATTDGDGRVTYESGKLSGVGMWYADAEHGDLANHEPTFPAILDLLERGTTTRLKTAPPSVARGGEAAYRALPEPVLYPTQASLTAGLMGQKRLKPYRKGAKGGFRVSVVHSDLRYARFPVVVGHYQGDTIVGAEAQLDRMLDGALSQRYSLGLYPGEFGSVSVVLRDPNAIQKALGLPRGAVVIGLGKWGELSSAQLGNLIRRAALQYVLQLDDCECDSKESSPNMATAGLSILLIGGNSTTNIATGDSVGAILRGIAQANRELDARAGDSSCIAEIEIVELFADTAIEAAHAVNRLAKLVGDELGTEIEAVPLLRRGREGRTRLTPTAARDPWRRWEISAVQAVESAPKPRIATPLAERIKRAIVATEKPDPELLGALAELAFGDAAERPTTHREIRFLTLSDRARAEAVTQQRQPELVERLIKDSITRTAFREQEARVLFELLIPTELKDGLAQLDNVVFVVDSETAAYPWELMGAGAEPLCVAKGLVRQLQTPRYRPHLGARAAQMAYVVGDPIVSLPFRQLAGARAEARAVAQMLRGQFEVVYEEEPLTALEVLAGLYAKPYRIVHLAGHGHYESPTTPGGKARSGMVLDNGVFLTAVEIAQMQQVPELVFLNCCHIGQTGPETPGNVSPIEFNRLAASVSRELIEMGVRSVVAAGWAVRDDAALHFAKAFYKSMLDGETFGRALKSARRDTWQRFADCNTWGAYQAYGDPDYRLDPTGARAPGGAGRYVDAAEFVEAINDIARTGADPSTSTKSRASASDRLDTLVKGCPVDWMSQTGVLMAIGYAYGELGRLDAANRYLLAALEGEGTENTATLHAVEQLANFEARLATTLARSAKDAAAKQQAREELVQAVHRLQGVLELAKTGERYALLGSAYKRLASLHDDPQQIRDNLALAATNYRLAHERALERRGLDPYPVLNWLSAAALLGAPVSDVETLLARSEAAAAERFAASRKFFEAVAIPDAALVRTLGAGVLAQGAKSYREVERLARLYQDTITQTSPSNREIDSALAQIEIMAALVEKLGEKDGAAASTARALRMLRQTITGETPAATAKGESTPPGIAAAASTTPSARTKTTPVKERKPKRSRIARKTRKKRRSNT
jgi:CHAT domain-containing protein/pimeloyl-ACP methyl ester carboxylesterase